MDNATHIENKRRDQMDDNGRWDAKGNPENAAAAMSDAYNKLSRYRARESDPADLNRCLFALAKFGADNPATMIENGRFKSELKRYINRVYRLESDRAEIRRQRDEAWDRIEELENSNV